MIPDLLRNPDALRWLLALFGASTIAILAWRLRSLSTGGMLAALLLGTVVTGGAGWWSGILLIAFFATASALSRTGHDTTTVSTARGSRRDAVQVAANGGIALACCLGYLLTRHHLWLVALAGSLAAANADTWSTEIGRTSHSLPRLITTGKRVPAGTSGAVSGRGLAGAAGGATLIGGLAAVAAATTGFAAPVAWITALIAVSLAGFAGSLLDSLLGATIQDQRWCDQCNTRTERRVHRCGTPTRSISGLPWVTNDVVNTACVLAGAVIASALGSVPG